MHKSATPKSGSVKTLDQVREEFSRVGRSVKSWAEENGFNPTDVYAVLYGRAKGLRGESHAIAVRLGIKHGVVVINKKRGHS